MGHMETSTEELIPGFITDPCSRKDTHYSKPIYLRQNIDHDTGIRFRRIKCFCLSLTVIHFFSSCMPISPDVFNSGDIISYIEALTHLNYTGNLVFTWCGRKVTRLIFF